MHKVRKHGRPIVWVYKDRYSSIHLVSHIYLDNSYYILSTLSSPSPKLTDLNMCQIVTKKFLCPCLAGHCSSKQRGVIEIHNEKCHITGGVEFPHLPCRRQLRLGLKVADLNCDITIGLPHIVWEVAAVRCARCLADCIRPPRELTWCQPWKEKS